MVRLDRDTQRGRGVIEVPAKIKSAFLGWEDHDIFTVILDVDYGGTGQGIGLHSLDKPVKLASITHRVGTAYGMDYIMAVLKACGVDEWNKLPGRTIYVLKAHDSYQAKVLGIKPFPFEKGEAFYFDNLATIHAEELAA